MAEIRVIPSTNRLFQVELENDDSTTHEVTVPDGYLEELGLEDMAAQDVVFESFRFLLEREPKEAILTSFELPVIARYFPSYPQEIADRMREG